MRSEIIPSSLQALWFDGRSTRARPASVVLAAGPKGPTLTLTALDNEPPQSRRFATHEVGWPERWSAGKAPPAVMVDLREHGSLQIDDVQGWRAALAQAGQKPPLAERMQTRWPVLLGVLVVAAVGIGAFYRWGTPWAATQITRFVPLKWEQDLSARAMSQIDGTYVKPSKLAPARQAELRAGFDRLASQIGPALQPYRHYAPPLKLEFRSGMPANAFALPGGTIVMTDAMVEAASKYPGTGENALLGVLAHEIGHVAHRHTTRMLVEQGVLNVGLGLALGDVSSLVSMGASLMTGLAYRRDHEAQSDCYAVALMKAAKLPTAPMADLLLAIDDEMGHKTKPSDIKNDSKQDKQHPGNDAKTPQKPPSNDATAFDWLSTHPNTRGRAERLKNGTLEGCPRVG